VGNYFMSIVFLGNCNFVKISHQRQFWIKKRMVEKIAEIFFYFVKTSNFIKVTPLRWQKSFLKDTQNSKNLAFAFSQKMKIDKNKSFWLWQSQKMISDFFFGTEEVLFCHCNNNTNSWAELEKCQLHRCIGQSVRTTEVYV